MCLCIHEVILSTLTVLQGGTRWRSSLKHCATSRKVAGLISDVVIKFFIPKRITALGSTEALTETSTRNVSWKEGIKGKALTALPFSCLQIWELQHPGNLMACPGLYRDCFTFFTVPSVLLQTATV
jgi:hypothetical protein